MDIILLYSVNNKIIIHLIENVAHRNKMHINAVE